MKALLIGSLVAILVIIGGAVSFMIIDSSNTIDAQVVEDSNKVSVKETAAKENSNDDVQTIEENSVLTSSFRDSIANLNIDEPVDSSDSSKEGYSLEYQKNQNNCEALIAFKEDDFNRAEEDYKDAKKAYEKAKDRIDDLENGEDIEEAQEQIQEKKDAFEKAEQALFNAREELIQTRTTCVG
ncbi:hypothetical protein JW851_04270, partial [Candidatus Woesearchaeota archaeon]|nr:hypothetical protein [Candidatus Woesearchaeota archaeon]